MTGIACSRLGGLLPGLVWVFPRDRSVEEPFIDISAIRETIDIRRPDLTAPGAWPGSAGFCGRSKLERVGASRTPEGLGGLIMDDCGGRLSNEFSYMSSLPELTGESLGDSARVGRRKGCALLKLGAGGMSVVARRVGTPLGKFGAPGSTRGCSRARILLGIFGGLLEARESSIESREMVGRRGDC